MTVNQSIEERRQILDAYERSEYFDKRIDKDSLQNLTVLREAFEGRYLDFSTIKAIIDHLLETNQLRRLEGPKVVEKIVEVEKPKSAQQIEREKRERMDQAGLGRRRTEFERIDEETAKQPSIYEQQRTAAQDAKQNAAKVEIDGIVSGYQAMRDGRVSHGRTAERREGLSKIRVFTDSSRQNVNWVETLRLVRAAVSKMD